MASHTPDQLGAGHIPQLHGALAVPRPNTFPCLIQANTELSVLLLHFPLAELDDGSVSSIPETPALRATAKWFRLLQSIKWR